jgi:sentrin-specific protease 1
VIRFEVEQQQQQQQQPILSMSVFDLATLLLGSVHVLDVYAEQEDTIHLGGGRFKSWIRKCHANHSKMGRKYQLTNAFQKLQASKNAQSTMLGSWEEVVAALQTVVELPTTFTQQQQQQENDDEDDAIAMQDFTHRMAKIRLQTIQEQQTSSIGLRTSQHLWQQVATSAKAASDHSNIRFDEEAIALTLEKETAKAQELADLRIHDIELRRLEKEREEEARQRAQKLLRPLSNQERNRVHDAMDERLGSDDDIVAQNGVDNIQRKSLRTLSPGEWLNDEVIHYFLGTLAERDAQLCAQQTGRARSHFFKSFFMTKLRNEGDQTGKHGVYEYRNVKRWSKNVPGKDIFKLEKIFFPINQNNMHWTLAVAFMKQKRIQFYDSMGGDGMVYLKDIFQYLQDEHREKKGCALPDLDQWTLAPCTKDTPRQLNGTYILEYYCNNNKNHLETGI